MIFSILRRLVKLFSRKSPTFATKLSLVFCVFMAITGITLGQIEGSLTISTNGLIAGIDILTSILFLAAVNQSVKTPDFRFNYGYGKYESMAILISSILTFLLTGFTVYRIVSNIGNNEIGGNSFTLILLSSVNAFLMYKIYNYLKKASKKFHMPLLKYDADLWKIDYYIELSVLISLIIGLVLSKFEHKIIASYLDSAFALMLIVYALKVPIKHGKDAINQLLDRTLPENIQYELLSVVIENLNRFCEFKNINTRQSGKDIFIELDVIMPYDFTLEEAYKLEKDIEVAFKKIYPTSLPRLYATPCIKDCHHQDKVNCPVKMALSKK